MGNVGIVCDSTCDLAPSQLEDMGVRMVPLKVLLGEETYLDWVELSPQDFYKKLASSPVLPKTSQPSPADFSEVYDDLVEQGCDVIISIHLSAALSGTHQSATIAASECSVPVHVIDTKMVSHGVALVIKEACAARDADGSTEEILARTLHVTERMRFFFVLDTLEYLVKGGRAGKAQGLAASLLNVKPVLRLNSDGIIEPFKKVKGRKKALSALAAHIAEDSAKNGRMRLSLLHGCSTDEAADLRSELEAAGADVEIESVGLIGSVIGTYAGPEATGCAYFPIG